MTRYLDTFFRHPLLYIGLFAAVLAGAVVSADRAMARTVPYTAEATFAANLDPTRGRDLGVRPPSEQYAELLGELMTADTFVINALLKGTSLAAQVTDETTAAAVARSVRENWRQQAAGPNTVRVSYSCHDPAVCAEVVNAVLAQYQDEISGTGERLSGAVISFYREQLALTEQRLRTLPPNDPSRDQVRATYEALLSRITDIELTHQLDEQVRRASFRVIAPATPPTERSSGLRAALMMLVAGGGAAVLLAVGLVMVMTWFDTAIRSPEQLAQQTGLPVALTLPHARRRRSAARDQRPAVAPAPVSIAASTRDAESRRA